jgi:hypothetical protein
MRKLSVLLVAGMISCWIQSVSAQSHKTEIENFDGNTVSFTSSPASAWKIDTNYYVSSHNSIRGVIPNKMGDSIVLTSPVYDLSNYGHVFLRFKHICKVSPSDITRVEYKISGQGWQEIPPLAYLGKASLNQLGMYKFNANNYPEWKGDDSLVFPFQSWWKEEAFDLGTTFGMDDEVQFRFILKHGNTIGTQVSYGWLIDNIEIIASSDDINLPVVEFVAPLVRDTLYSAGPWKINAKVKSHPTTQIENPWLVYSATNVQGVENDSILMTHLNGDSLWEATIPQIRQGTKVVYSITGKDLFGNYSTGISAYMVQMPSNASDYGNNSAAVYSIDTYDTVAVTPGMQIPVIATIKNKSASNLTSATVYYSINGNTPQSYTWTDNLLWDFNRRDTLNYYTPKVNGKDTITVWVKTPNGQTDPVVNDDTLTKIIYGKSDLAITFIDAPDDTVMNTGLFEITAEIYSYSGYSVIPTSLPLYVTSTFQGQITYDTLSMFQTSGNLWKTTLPQKVFGSDVTYAIKLTDVLGNLVSIEDGYYIKRLSGGLNSEIIIGTGTGSSNNAPLSFYWEYNWSRQLYLGTEFSPDAEGGTITKLAFEYANATAWARANQSCYFRAVDNTAITATAYEDPIAAGGVPVWQGTLSATGAGWVEMTLTTPFVLPPGKNLLIYWHNESNTYGSSLNWRYTTTTQNMTIHAYSMFAPLPTTPGTLSKNRPNARFYVTGKTTDSNSVALFAIHSPESTKGILADGRSVPVQLSILNAGILNLDSCTINWSFNGQIKTPVVYRGSLPEEFTDTITIGSYIPTANKQDTIIVWVSMPNGVTDPTTKDDTLMVVSLGCAYVLSGTINVGSGESFTSVNDVLNSIRECGALGDITIALKGTFDENIDLNGISDNMDGYTLTITSADNDADSAIIKPVSGTGIKIGNDKNINLKAITVDVSASEASAIEFTGTCTNIVIRDCKLLTNTTATPTGYTPVYAPIYKASGTAAVADSVFIIHNTLNGGDAGFYFQGGIGAGTGQYSTNIVFDSNTVSNNYFYGIYLRYVDLKNCSCNTVLSRTSNTNSYWNAIDIEYSNGPVTGNRIVQRTNDITEPNGMYFVRHNSFLPTQVQGRSLIANNEIILNSTSTSNGIFAFVSKLEIIHNSIYISGNGSARGIGISCGETDDLVVKNNNIVLTSPTAYPVYFIGPGNLNLYDMDYNNYYAPSYIGYYRVNMTTMAQWQQLISTDQHSVKILPDFINPSGNLKFINYGGLFCNNISSVNKDIENENRVSLTTMGCYEIPLKNGNAIFTEITGLRNGSILSQTDTVKAIVLNAGTATLTSVHVNWSINGNRQTMGGINFPVSLTTGQSDTLVLGVVTYVAGNMDIKVWINSLNGGALTDENRKDDTLSRIVFICTNGVSGLITVGTNSNNDFQTISQFYEALNVCGVSGDITLGLESGIYPENLDFSNNSLLMSNHSLTITSIANNATDVIIRPPSGTAIVLSNSNNIAIKAITVDAATSGTNAIEFIDPCTNILIRDCKLLANPIVTTGGFSPISKSSGGIVDSIFIINNTLDGGYDGFLFYGGTGNAYGTNVVFDSNIISNSYSTGITSRYVTYKSCSYNTILSRTSNFDIYWTGIWRTSTNGPLVGNRIIQRDNGILNPFGIWSYYHNYNNTYPESQVPDIGLIANNEIILNSSSTEGSGRPSFGIHANNSNSKIIHNSIYISGSGYTRGIYFYDNTNKMVIKNNSIVLTTASSHPIYLPNSASLNLYDIDYNNYYSNTHIGYYSGNQTTMTQWQQTIPTDQHSVKILPAFINPSVSLELSTYSDNLLCPNIGVQTDIEGLIRPHTTAMGAYTHATIGQDLALSQISPLSEEIIRNQTVQVSVDVINMGVTPITNATLEWSLNGVTQQPPLSWTATPSLNSLEQRNIALGNFQAINGDTFHIVVWVKTINGQQDTVHLNDTLSTTYVVHPLAEFTVPVEDTIYVLNFDVNAKIYASTGAPIRPPNLYLETIVNGFSFLYDTVPMTFNNGIWQANIPPQYYGSKVIYSLNVSDNIGNTFTAIDSVYIQSLWDKTDTVIIGTGISRYYYTPINMNYGYGWSRQIYLYKEICPDLPSSGIYITKIAWESAMANTYYINQSCYMRAIDDSIVISSYSDPLMNGLSQVWAGSLIIQPGWVEITLDTPFFLPAGKTLEITWHHQNGYNHPGTSHTWAHTQTKNYMTAYNGSIIFPNSSGTLSYNRPNIKITKEFPVGLYSGNDLELTSFISPIENFTSLCANDYAPVTIILRNLGENDYDFSVDTVVLQLEITYPQQTKDTVYLPIYNGMLAAGKADTIELMAALPVRYPGRYEFKAWLESPVDNVVFDNTRTYSYVSGIVGLPVDEDFSGVFPIEFAIQSINSSAIWTIVPQGSGADTVVKPVFGSGMLAFTGDRGAITHLSTRPLELTGTVLPTLEFWYFHDTIPSEDYMDVRITTDGGATYTALLSLLKQDAVYGWHRYTADLTPYIDGECILVLFEAMRKSPGVGSQYIDRIVISSQPDLAVSKVALPIQTACDLKNAEMEVIISTITNQTINLSLLSTSLAVEIPNYQSLPPIPLQKRMEGHSSDTIYIPVPDLPVGNYNIKVYLTSPVDNIPANDTLYYGVNVNPALSVTVKSLTGGINCFKKGMPAQQEVILQNTGNTDITGVKLSLLVTGDNYTETVIETGSIDLSAGDSVSYIFENTYTVPAEANYQVQVFAWMECDSIMVNSRGVTYECVDLDNIAIISIENPVNGQRSVAGSTDNIIVSIVNESDNRRYSNVTIVALIENVDGQMLSSRMEIIPVLEPDSTYQFTFTETYTVPEDSVYFIRVYINSMDIYPEDDTLKIQCYSESVGIETLGAKDGFTLGQNIPNPATNSTRIDYAIPEAGEVIFHVHTISGQLLYSKTIEAPSGTNSLELNTSAFAAGVYYYSIEYKGQKRVKQLGIVK